MADCVAATRKSSFDQSSERMGKYQQVRRESTNAVYAEHADPITRSGAIHDTVAPLSHVTTDKECTYALCSKLRASGEPVYYPDQIHYNLMKSPSLEV
jgi:hypothetical protein